MPALRPEHVSLEKQKHIPEFVFDAFNELIATGFNGRSARVEQKDVIERIQFYAGYGEIDRQEIFDKGYLNIEDIYREAGWKVEYDKPGYNETYGAYWIFKK